MRSLPKIIITLTLGLGSLLTLRFVLKMTGANTAAPFVYWLYNTTDYFMAPFHNIFPTPYLGDIYIIDIPALFALAMYLILGYVISSLVASFVESIYRKINAVKKALGKPSQYGDSEPPPLGYK